MTSNLPTLPAEWEWKKLDEILLIERGGSPRPIDDYITTDKNGINWIKIGDTKNTTKYIYETAEKIKPEGLRKSRLVQEGDFILSNSMSFGRPYIMKTTGCIHDGWLLLRAKSDNLDQNFLYHVLSSPFVYQQFKNKASGTTVKNLNSALVKTVEIPLPPLDEQKRLVSLLDTLFAKIDRSIELLSENITAADLLLPSALNTVFGELGEKYGTINLDKVTKFSQGIQVALNDQFDCYEEGLYKFLRIINYTQNSDDLRYIKQFSEKAYVHENDIVMVRYGAKAGFVGKGLSGIIANNMFRVIPNDLFLNNFIYYTLTNPKNQEILYSNIGAAAMPAINFGTMSLLEIPNVDTTIQTQSVAYLDSIRHKVAILKQVQNDKITYLKALKASILDRAFKGEL